ncbi:MAG: SDR family oxidoreductase [Marinovum sp.]|nr:SDR family oxidoreductase [Marinovum sp.]
MSGKVSFDFSGTNVMVFGGTSGINLGIAESFARSGAHVSVVGRKADKAEAAAAQLADIAPEGVGAKFYTADVRDLEAVEAVYASHDADVGKVDVLVSGAAGNFPALFNQMSSNGFKAVVEIDLVGTFHVLRAGFEHLRGPGASVINISAPQAEIAMGLQSHVCAAKAGVDMVTKTLSIEWGAKGIRVNSVIPGPIDGTEGMARLAPTEQMRKAVINAVPLGRFGTPDDVAQTCLFLASDAGRYVSGAILPADGGWLAAGARLGF